MTIPYGKHSLDEVDIQAVLSVLYSGWLTQGPLPEQFENVVASFVGSAGGVSANSATSCLHIACIALDVGKNDIVWTVPNTFVASANCALLCGASVDFVDIELETGNICVSTLRTKLEKARDCGDLPKVLIPVHFAGFPCDMKSIAELSREFGFKIIEDASHALGAKYECGNFCGSSIYSDITVFSFHPVKIATSVEGGVAVSNDLELLQKMKILRSHGITSDPDMMVQTPVSEIWGYQQLLLGLNYRMSDIHAALGLSQMKKVPNFVRSRRNHAERYNTLLKSSDVLLPPDETIQTSSFHLYCVQVLNGRQRYVFDHLRNADILCNLHYIPVYLQPFYQKKFGFPRGYCPNSEIWFKRTISIPLYPALTRIEQDFVVKVIIEALH